MNPKKLKSTQLQQLAPKSDPSEFDINEIKTFKFKKCSERKSSNVKRHQREIKQNPWDSLMNEIRANPCDKLKKVDSDDKSSKQRKFSPDHIDYENIQGSQLIRDLNLILSQRSHFFNDHEDDNDSSDEWDCSNED